jgi:hypothetical protein
VRSGSVKGPELISTGARRSAILQLSVHQRCLAYKVHERRQMIPRSHQALMETPQVPRGDLLLAEAVSDFITASSKLERAYQNLRIEVAELRQALNVRNWALSEGLSDSRVMREQLLLVLEAVPCGVLVIDREGALTRTKIWQYKLPLRRYA